MVSWLAGTLWMRAVEAAATPAEVRIPGAESFVYKTVNGVNLRLFVWKPQAIPAAEKRSAIVFFHGGGWSGGNPVQYQPQALYFAHRGMVVISVQYRLYPQVKVTGCLTDTKSAIRWVRTHAQQLGIDPQRITACGDSAGGHLVAAAGIIDGYEESGEDLAISSRPDAMVLFNPGVLLAAFQGQDFPRLANQTPQALQERLGVEPELLSPIHHIQKGNPPTILMHGTIDTVVPFGTAVLFAEQMQKLGNRCDLVPYPERNHTFFDYNSTREDFISTVKEMDKFLCSLGYLNGAADIEQMIKKTR